MIDAKVIIVGNSYVGKTSLVHRYVHGEHSGNLGQTIGAAFYSLTKQINGKNVKFFIWDTAGQEKFRSICKMYYRGAKACLCVCDVTDKKSFDDIEYWVNSVRESASDDVKIILLANKTDLNQSFWKVTEKEINEKAEKLGIEYLLTSSITGANITKSFEILGDHYVKIKEIDNIEYNGILLNELPSFRNNCYCNII